MRVNVNISDEMNKEFVKLGAEYSMSKSSIMSFILGQWLKEQRQIRVNQELFIDAQVDRLDKLKEGK